MDENYENRSTTSTSSEAENTITLQVSEKIEEKLYNWYSECLNRKLSINRSMLKKKALSLFQEFGNESYFKNDWLNNWRKKYGILQLPLINRSSMAPSMEEIFDMYFKKLIKDENISYDQIFTCFETGLYYKMLPTSELIYQSQINIPNFDVTSNRVTIFICTNASGTLKFPLLVVDKQYKPQALKNIKPNNLPLIYQYQKSAWVDTSVYQNWFDTIFVPRVTKFLHEKDLPQKAILIVDNAPLHASEDKLRCGNIRSTLLNINVQSITRRINQEIMRDLKIRYRYRMLQSLLEYQHDKIDIMQRLYNITIKDVIFWLADAWSDVSTMGIKRIWDRLWHEKKFVQFDENDSMSILDLAKLCLQINGCQEIDIKDMEKLMDKDNRAMYNLSDEEIIEIVLQTKRDDEQHSNELTQKIDNQTAQQQLETLISFFETQQVPTDDLITLNLLRNKIKACQRFDLYQQPIQFFQMSNPLNIDS
ncbi:jerky protein homolog-like [Leptopilina boulardi]|uniref:jerky protein homolog-like n=1 Tax=Leptopilina boulardi TaxID=63433 RepID=UPI0021F6282B|nr:jerky protein homolog-like [Leptopilina boulardi]